MGKNMGARYKSNLNHSGGFTVAELIVVIVVIAILATVAIIGFGNWQASTERTVLESDLAWMLPLILIIHTLARYPQRTSHQIKQLYLAAQSAEPIITASRRLAMA